MCLQPDYAKLAGAIRQSPQAGAVAGSGCLPAQLTVQPHNGRTVINAEMVDAYDSSAAGDTVMRLRSALHAVPDANAQIGGQAAINRDTLDASARDRNVIILLVLLVSMIISAYCCGR